MAGCNQAVPPQTKDQPAPVKVKLVQPRRGEITRTVLLPGNVVPNQQATLYAKITGYLEKIGVDKGDTVKKGDLIATIEAPELLADRAKFKADMEVADLDYQRTTKAREKAPDLVVIQSVDAARAKFLTAKASLDRAETLLNFCSITAPFSGAITRRFVDPGAFIPAATSGTAAQGAAIVTLMDFSVVRVQVAVPEPEVPFIKRSLPVQVLVEELPGQAFPGTITRYSPSLDEAKTMLVEIDLQNPKNQLIPGMYTTVKIGVEKKSDALLLPLDAVMIEKAGASAFTIVDGKAKKQPLRTGFNDGTSIEILDGIKPGDAVILVGKQTLNNGQPVTVGEAK